MVTEMIVHSIRTCNMFPSPDGISNTLSPLSIVTGAGKINYNHLKLEFGTFVHILNDNQPTNTMAPRTTGAIALNSVGNSKGDYYFLNLETGRRVSRHQWTVLPMPHSVIQQVHLLALKDKMPLLRQQSLIFERRPGVHLIQPLFKTKLLIILFSAMTVMMRATTPRMSFLTYLYCMTILFL